MTTNDIRDEGILICPEDLVGVLLPAGKIPHRSTVRKRTGEKEYTLIKRLVVRPMSEGDKPLVIDGIFIVSGGDVAQLKPDALLHWVLDAESLVEILAAAWNERGDDQ
jgi:hypothetical protein